MNELEHDTRPKGLGRKQRGSRNGTRVKTITTAPATLLLDFYMYCRFFLAPYWSDVQRELVLFSDTELAAPIVGIIGVR